MKSFLGNQKQKEGFESANLSSGINLLRDSANGKIPDVETKSKNSNFRMLEVISKKELIKICENWGVKLKD